MPFATRVEHELEDDLDEGAVVDRDPRAFRGYSRLLPLRDELGLQRARESQCLRRINRARKLTELLEQAGVAVPGLERLRDQLGRLSPAHVTGVLELAGALERGLDRVDAA